MERVVIGLWLQSGIDQTSECVRDKQESDFSLSKKRTANMEKEKTSTSCVVFNRNSNRQYEFVVLNIFRHT